MAVAKKKNQAKKLKDTAKSRQNRYLKQKLLLSFKLILLLFFIFMIGLLYINMDKISQAIYQTTANIGFTLEHITLEGQKYSNVDKISKDLNLKKGMPIFSISLDTIKNRLEKVQWIKYAIVERELPSTIHISIVERTPICLGQKDRKLYLIDDEGVIINEKNLSPFMNLPIIIGDGAEIYANSLIKILKEDPELFKKIVAIVHVSERRWNIKLDNDLEIKLPEENIEQTWKKVIKLYHNKELFLPEIAVIDLRIANKIYVEKK